MYKKQLILQKIICLTALLCCAVIFVYSLGIMTDLYELIRGQNNIGREDAPYETEVRGSWIYYEMQPFNRTFTGYSLGMIGLALFLFITGTHSRRKYYIGNFLSVGLFSAAGIAFSVWSHLQIEKFRADFLKMDFEALRAVSDRMKGYYTESTFWFDVHYAIFALLLAVIVFLLVNVLLKIYLMQKEKKLIRAGMAGRGGNA